MHKFGFIAYFFRIRFCGYTIYIINKKKYVIIYHIVHPCQLSCAVITMWSDRYTNVSHFKPCTVWYKLTYCYKYILFLKNVTDVFFFVDDVNCVTAETYTEEICNESEFMQFSTWLQYNTTFFFFFFCIDLHCREHHLYKCFRSNC
jgi:hypothetical protein